MPGFVPGIHVFLCFHSASKTWMAGTSPAKTLWRVKSKAADARIHGKRQQPSFRLVAHGSLPQWHSCGQD
jgi:hypothetical protein